MHIWVAVLAAGYAGAFTIHLGLVELEIVRNITPISLTIRQHSLFKILLS